MYAVIATGGKQYRVAKGQTLKIEKLPEDAGKSIEFAEVILTADGDKINVGAPFVKGAKVMAEIVSQGRGDKVRILKFRRRKHHMKQAGHRQYLTEVKITDIQLS